VLLLSEVALGSMYEYKKDEYVEGLPVGHSTFGVGKTMPDKNDVLVMDDGVTVPLGKGIESRVKGSDLLYNE
jgi:poly [ADP-ribose] polymerase